MCKLTALWGGSYWGEAVVWGTENKVDTSSTRQAYKLTALCTGRQLLGGGGRVGHREQGGHAGAVLRAVRRVQAAARGRHLLQRRALLGSDSRPAAAAGASCRMSCTFIVIRMCTGCDCPCPCAVFVDAGTAVVKAHCAQSFHKIPRTLMLVGRHHVDPQMHSQQLASARAQCGYSAATRYAARPPSATAG